MNGLILAAGEGRRLAADGVRQPKSLVQVGGRAQLPHLIGTLRALGCETVTCMVPFQLARRLSALSSVADQPRITVVGCRTPSSLHTLALGLAAIPSGTVLCTMVDTVMRGTDWTTLGNAIQERLDGGTDLVLAVTPYVDDERPVYVAVAEDGTVRGISETPVEPVAVTGGVYGLSNAARAAVRGAIGRQTERLRQFLAFAAAGSLRVTAVSVPRIIDLDRASDLAAANRWIEDPSVS
jgi:NDP-sugar pyrophosphorylase family protein